MRVLFVGNSYTYYNHMPEILQKIGESKGTHIECDMVVKPGGYIKNILEDESAENIQLHEKLNHKWDYVFIQEQSQLPGIKGRREIEMYPNIAILKGYIESIKAQPMLFMTWGHRYGDKDNGNEGYERMQNAVSEGYREAAEKMNIRLAPVGIVWRQMVQEGKGDLMWTEDNSHPTLLGSYMAACVFYKTLTGNDLNGAYYPLDIEKNDALLIHRLTENI